MLLAPTTPSIMVGVVTAAINAIAPIFHGLVDQGSRPMGLQLRAAWSTKTQLYPNVTVSFQPGESEDQPGEGLQRYDEDTGQFLYGQYMEDAEIVYSIRAQSEGDREWLLDWLYSGILAKALPDEDGTLVPGAVKKFLGAWGIVVNKQSKVNYPAPDPDDTRPAGQRYDAAFSLVCDVSLAWEQPGVTVNHIAITATPSPAYLGIVGDALAPDPTITIS